MGKSSLKVDSIIVTHPLVANLWCHQRNESLKPTDVSYSSKKRVHWQCGKCSHVWNARVDRVCDNKVPCPICRENIPFKESLAFLFPDVAKEWSDRNEKKPMHFRYQSNKKAYWVCSTCTYKWKTQICKRTGTKNQKGRGCPGCSGQAATPFNNFAITHPRFAKEWSNNNNKKAHEVTPNSTYLAEWVCPKCTYIYKMKVHQRIKMQAACTGCSGQTATPFNNLRITHPIIAEEWDQENSITPEEVTQGSGFKAKWICKKCDYRYICAVGARTLRGRGCHQCAHQVPNAKNNLAKLYPRSFKTLELRKEYI